MLIAETTVTDSPNLHETIQTLTHAHLHTSEPHKEVKCGNEKVEHELCSTNYTDQLVEGH